MPDRPAIPLQTQRKILLECGYCCAACGAAAPLEKAHIIPWNKSKDHSPENLICLCANCHSRADNENWGTKMLRMFKASPYIKRYPGNRSPIPARLPVTITIKYDWAKFDESKKAIFIYGLAKFLDVSPDDIIIEGLVHGSVIIQFSVPEYCRETIEKVIESDLHALQFFFNPYEIVEVKIENILKYEFTTDNVTFLLKEYFGLKDELINKILPLWLSLNDKYDLNKVEQIKQELIQNATFLSREIIDMIPGIVDKIKVPCPRCLGKGFVGWEDINRLNMYGHWMPAICQYCDGNGSIPLHVALLKGITDPPP